MQSKIKNILKELRRLVPLTLTPSQLIREFKFQSPYGQLGRPYRYIPMANNQGYLRNDDRSYLEVPRDRFDQIFDTFAYLIDLYIFRMKCEMCNHPRDECYYEWDGDREIGYIRQLTCRKCGDCLRDEHDCSRYTGVGLNHGPIPGAETPPWIDAERSYLEDDYDYDYDYDPY